MRSVFFFQAEDGIRDADVTGVQTCALPISATALVWSAAIQDRDETRELKWEVLEGPRQTGPEVRLYLGGSSYLYSYSSELAHYLRSRHNETIPVSLPVSRNLGCF